MAEQNIDVVDFSSLTSANDGQTVLFKNGTLYQSSGTIGQIVDSKVTSATSDFATTVYVDTEIGKIGNYIITSADASGRPDIDVTAAGMKNIYLIKDDTVTGTDKYKEWIVTESADVKSWTCIGDTSIELSGYQTVGAMSSYYTKSETSGAQDIANALSTKQDITTLMNNVNADVGKNNLSLVKVNNEIQNINWNGLKNDGGTNVNIDQDILQSDLPFFWGVNGPDPTTFVSNPNNIKITFSHNLDYYDSIKIVIDSNVSQVMTKTTVELKNKNVGDEVVSWVGGGTKILIKEIGTNYITIYQNNYYSNGGIIYDILTTPEIISKLVISTNAFNCSSINNSIVFGNSSSALGSFSFAVGDRVNAIGTNSFAEGFCTSAYGSYSHAEGNNTSAAGSYSHAEGYGSKALGSESHTEGFNTIAGDEAMHVGGKYNSISSNAAFVIGNGNSDTRSDAFIVDWNGNTSAVGTLAISGIADVGAAITSINSVPISTSADEGKVLTVSSNGSPVWDNAGGSSESFIVRALIYKGASILNDSIIMDKTYSEIDTAYKAGKNVEINFYPVDTTPSSTSDIDTEFETQTTTPFIAKLELVSSGRGPDMQLHNAYRFMFKNLDLIYGLNYYESNNVYAYSRKYSSIIIDIQSYGNYVTSIANNTNQQNNIIYIDDTEWTNGQWNNFYDLLIYYLNSHDSLTFRIFTAGNQPYRLLRLTRYQPEYEGTTAYFEFIGFNSFSSYDKLTITPITEDGQTLVHYKFETISAS